MLACSAMVACTNTDEPEVDNGGAKGNESYLAVKLVNPSAGSRATGNYAYGSEAEQTVTSARFYLFDANGGAYIINDESKNPSNNNKNYVDAKEIKSEDGFKDTGSTNVETVLEAVLVINSSKKLPPAKIMAVLNYSDELGTANLSLTELKDKVANFGTIKDETNPAPYVSVGKFVMSNSVYVDAAGNLAEATPIAAENIATESDLAKENPVKIYVERVAAKVQTEVSVPTTVTEETKNAGKFFIQDGKYYAFTGEEDASGNKIYACLKGWRVTNITNQSNLIKDLDATADANLTWTWNNADDYRSYWADANHQPSFVWTFNEANLPFTDVNYEYYNENTQNVVGNHSSNKNSQLLVAAEFVTFTADGKVNNPQPIAEWYGVKYTLEGLKNVVADALASKLYTKETDNSYVSIAPSAITFTQVEANLADNRYISKIGVADNTYYYKNGKEMKAYTATEVQAIVDALQTTKIWGNIVNDKYVGGGYYYLDIEHDKATKTYGLVRNHWYKLTLNSLAGLGTPVYDPDKVITTETPETDASFIAAEINVLAWRMVEQGVDLK